MAIHKSRLQRKGRDRKQEQRFFIMLGILTVILMIVLYIIYG